MCQIRARGDAASCQITLTTGRCDSLLRGLRGGPRLQTGNRARCCLEAKQLPLVQLNSGPENHRKHWRNVANTIERCVSVGDAACRHS